MNRMGNNPERVLIHAPYGRDGALLRQMLERARFTAETFPTPDSLCAALANGAGALLIADEALGGPQVAQLASALQSQPAWSDLAVLVMTSGGETTEASRRRLQLLEPLAAPVTLLERPLRIETLLSAIRTSLRARRRQYEIRDLLENQEKTATALAAVNEALRRSNEDLSNFAYAASHDLKEPLRTVANYTELLRRRYQGKLDAEADLFIGFSVEAVRRMDRLIQDLLDYAQISNEANSQPVIADSAIALREAQTNLRLLIEETAAVITAGNLPEVAADPGQLTQIFQNLLSNALKYRKPDEPPRVEVSASRNAGGWTFAVADNGIGFDQKHADLVFGIFKRLHGKDVPGTGIGLAMCKRIVEQCGGQITATSQPGKGATFCFTLPAAEPTEKSD